MPSLKERLEKVLIKLLGKNSKNWNVRTKNSSRSLKRRRTPRLTILQTRRLSPLTSFLISPLKEEEEIVLNVTEEVVDQEEVVEEAKRRKKKSILFSMMQRAFHH